jgi:hypothetical protein
MRGNAAKSKKLLFEGRSIVLNVLFVAMNVFGAAFLLHVFFVDTNASELYKYLGFGMFIGSAVMLFILKGFYMYAYFARLVLAVVLLISGFSKLNDPIGFSQIIEQYFQDGALSLKMSQTFGWTDFSLAKYSSWAFKISVTLAISEILLALMLLYHMLYKIAVFLLLPLVLVFSYVTYYSATCDESNTFQHEFSLNAYDSKAQELFARSQSDETLTFLEEKNNVLYFSENHNHVCLDKCGCFGDSNTTFFGLEMSTSVSFSRNLMLLLFAVILFITQFWLLPNSSFENTLYGICAWIAILIQGIISGWFWLVVLSGIVLYLATNVRRFGVALLKTHIGALIFVSMLLVGVLFYVVSFEPLSDFRAYAIGSSLAHPEDSVSNETTTVFVYQHKLSKKVVYLSEEMRADSPIVSDTNYIFLREKEHKINPFENHSNKSFKPVVFVNEVQNKGIQHPMINSFIEKFSEELYRIKNKQTGHESVIYSIDFNQDLYKDTNLVIEKFLGIHDDYTFFDLGPALVSSELVFIWVVKDIRKITAEHWKQIQLLSQDVNEEQYDIVALGYQRSALWYEKSGLAAESVLYLNMDVKELNQICRSNVCLMVLKKGVVEAKYPLRGLPRFETISAKLRLE